MPAEKYDFAKEFKEIYISKQRSAPPPVPEDMKVQLQSYPPLGQATPVESGDTTLTAVLEIPQDREQESWEVALWASLDGAEWIESILSRIDVGLEPQTLQAVPNSVSKLYFACSLCFATSVQFTLKFRHEKDEPWRWIRDEQGLNDGVIVATSPPLTSDMLQDLIPDLDGEWKVSSRMSQSSQTQLWTLEVTIPPADGDTSTFKDIEIGTPWFAIVRLWSPWLAPRQGKTHFSLDKDAILCSFLSPKGKSLVFLAVSGIGNVLTTLRNTERGSVSVHARNDGASDEMVLVLVSESNDFEHAVASVMYHARTLVSQAKRENPEWENDMKSLAEQVKPEWKENWYDGLGFCTWNALGQKLTEQKVLEAVQKLAENDINITSLIIDDNWQSIDYKGDGQFQYAWVEFEAERKAFPNGLKSMVSRIRHQYPDVQHIAVWHALLGYWGGISPGGKLDQAYKTIEVIREDSKRRNLPLGGKMTVVAKEDVTRFYDDFYQFLADAGIDGVKTDAQFMIDTWTSASVRRDLINTYLDAWTMASFRHFSVKAISCMSQIPQALFYSQMPQNRPPLLVRSSDDFFPEIPASHPWHVWANAHNSIFMQFLNVLPDWDMFQTVHDYSGFHAASRCVSGGPIYVTDVPGEHNMDLIGQMTGVTPNGKTVIFRPSVLGKSIYPYMGYDDDSLLKVGSYHGGSQTGTGILGVFNISARQLTEIVPLSCFPGTVPSMEYVIRAHTTGKVSHPASIGHQKSLITASLDVRGYEILCAFLLTSFSGIKHKDGWAANLGLVGKMTGCAAIMTSSISQFESGRVSVVTRLKALGVLGIYISTLATMTVEGDFMATIQDQPVPRHTVRLSKEDDSVFEVDIQAAWNEMGLDAGRSNEVEVKVHFSA
ncbi:putative galactinol--sucrose galactosyltransferase 6 [Tolypocladium ophioglossoides CBS 100239]|uniref:Putative galactinol--sucrose galactosyltransferase 6 n=1 Tax=Tolypocladium ophioglossoides (strain CBS 100239) TaxID=1163406 RepID=A0A0L0NBV4_TOLOC|nr:putative galactinol--sucrose galactosyltransferase 6 [Tolypocladium ophioglossoides CBS 100239]